MKGESGDKGSGGRGSEKLRSKGGNGGLHVVNLPSFNIHTKVVSPIRLSQKDSIGTIEISAE